MRMQRRNHALALAPTLGLLVVSSLLPQSSIVHACTTVLATPGATEDGSCLASHSNDGEGTTDPRLVVVPAAEYPEGSMREVHYAYEEYPRYLDRSRRIPEYYPTGEQTARIPIGHIPQVKRTFKYFEETYGVINEKQVGIAESTCSAIFGATAVSKGGSALMSIDTLTQLAMERASTAKEAVELMGQMAVQYGFYGADSFEGTAESLLVIDPTEGWVFHVLPDPTGGSAIWVAQRVPDGHVTVVPNIFIIREVDLDSPDFLASENLFSVAQDKGLWTPGQKFDFTAIYSEGEYLHKYYCGRRLWRAYSLLAPSQTFDDDYEDLAKASPYPFSIAPDSKVSVRDVMAVMRDYFEGTKYDLTQGPAAGPFGTPDRWLPGKGEEEVRGGWERPIAIFKSSDSFVVQARAWLPAEVGGVVWFGPHGAHATCYVPLPVGMLALPAAYRVGDPERLDRASAYWAHRYVENLANVRWSDMIRDIRGVAAILEGRSRRLMRKIEKLAGQAGHGGRVSAEHADVLTAALKANAESVVKRWWTLPDMLMEKYADGNVRGKPVGYPEWWLQAVGYADGPTPISASQVWFPPGEDEFVDGGWVDLEVDSSGGSQYLHTWEATVA